MDGSKKSAHRFETTTQLLSKIPGYAIGIRFVDYREPAVCIFYALVTIVLGELVVNRAFVIWRQVRLLPVCRSVEPTQQCHRETRDRALIDRQIPSVSRGNGRCHERWMCQWKSKDREREMHERNTCYSVTSRVTHLITCHCAYNAAIIMNLPRCEWKLRDSPPSVFTHISADSQVETIFRNDFHIYTDGCVLISSNYSSGSAAIICSSHSVEAPQELSRLTSSSTDQVTPLKKLMLFMILTN